MFYIYMSFKLIFIKEVFFTETTVWMHKSYISKLIYISFIHMFIKSFEGVEFLLLKNTCFFLETNLTV